MIVEILDELIAQAELNNWEIKYVALEPNYMKMLIAEVGSVVGNVTFSSIATYKTCPIKEKEICGFQVAYCIKP